MIRNRVPESVPYSDIQDCHFPETNKNNQDYFNWKIIREGDINSLPNSSEIYGICKNLFNSIKDGTVKAAEDVADSQNSTDEDIPF